MTLLLKSMAFTFMCYWFAALSGLVVHRLASMIILPILFLAYRKYNDENSPESEDKLRLFFGAGLGFITFMLSNVFVSSVIIGRL